MIRRFVLFQAVNDRVRNRRAMIPDGPDRAKCALGDAQGIFRRRTDF
jgi:hypothetical protein